MANLKDAFKSELERMNGYGERSNSEGDSRDDLIQAMCSLLIQLLERAKKSVREPFRTTATLGQIF